jgi:hypothetical protein
VTGAARKSFDGVFSSMSEVARQKFIAQQPIQRMQHFARLLGWNDLRFCPFRRPESPDGFFVFYGTTDEKFNLQIGQRTDLGEKHYAAAVIAERYGISFVPHQPFTLCDDPAELLAEANRLRPLLARSNFKNPQWRRWLAEQHPTWIMHRYRQRNKFLNEVRQRAEQLAKQMRKQGLNPYDA